MATSPSTARATRFRGKTYGHLLPEADAKRSFLDDDRILAAVRNRFDSHKAGDLNRVLGNAASSQQFCFNLFVPLASNLGLASQRFGASYPEKPGCKERCTDPAFYVDMIEQRTPDARGRALCGYLRYANWRLTETSRAVDITAIRAASACPFSLSGQQGTNDAAWLDAFAEKYVLPPA